MLIDVKKTDMKIEQTLSRVRREDATGTKSLKMAQFCLLKLTRQID